MRAKSNTFEHEQANFSNHDQEDFFLSARECLCVAIADADAEGFVATKAALIELLKALEDSGETGVF